MYEALLSELIFIVIIPWMIQIERRLTRIESLLRRMNGDSYENSRRPVGAGAGTHN